MDHSVRYLVDRSIAARNQDQVRTAVDAAQRNGSSGRLPLGRQRFDTMPGAAKCGDSIVDCGLVAPEPAGEWIVD